MTETGPVAQQGWLQRWGLGVVGPAAVLMWAASQQFWGWVVFAAVALVFGVFRIFRPLPGQRETQGIVWGVAAFSVAFAAFSWLAAIFVVIKDGTSGAGFCAVLLAVQGTAWGALGMFSIWPQQTARVLHMEGLSGSRTYRDPNRPAGPNDVLPQ